MLSSRGSFLAACFSGLSGFLEMVALLWSLLSASPSLLSSASLVIVDCITFSRSLIKVLNRTSLQTDPCNTLLIAGPQHRLWHFNHCSLSPTFQAVFYLSRCPPRCPPICTVKRLVEVNHTHCSAIVHKSSWSGIICHWLTCVDWSHSSTACAYAQECVPRVPGSCSSSCWPSGKQLWLMASWPWASSTHSLVLSLSIGAFLLLSVPNIFRSFTFCYMNFVLLLSAQDFIEFAGEEPSREGFPLSLPFSAC